MLSRYEDGCTGTGATRRHLYVTLLPCVVLLREGTWEGRSSDDATFPSHRRHPDTRANTSISMHNKTAVSTRRGGVSAFYYFTNSTYVARGALTIPFQQHSRRTDMHTLAMISDIKPLHAVIVIWMSVMVTFIRLT